MAFNRFKKIIPTPLVNFIRPYYHGLLALSANIYFGRPSQRLVVIGITGTAGKSTTVQMISHILNSVGRKCGYITTAGAFDGENKIVNKKGISMPGGPALQKMLKAMLENGCSYAVVEATSEGLRQNRHLGINFDVALITNLSEAHLDAHGSFEKYKQDKGKLPAALQKGAKKSIFPKKIIGANLDDLFSDYFLNFKADEKFTVSLLGKSLANVKNYSVREVEAAEKLNFEILGVNFLLNVLGAFNIYNAALAAACANMLGLPLTESAAALNNFSPVAGRMQEIPTGKNFRVFVDYAPEPAGMRQALQTVKQLPHQKIIHVFGSTGGHRDSGKRFEFGKISAQYADTIIITNDDVYESDPKEIANNIESGIRNQELWKGQCEIILDRRSAIRHSLKIAGAGDIVIFTGKGNEQFLVLPGNKRINWDEAKVIQEELIR